MPKTNKLKGPLKVPCGRISASGRVCTVKQLDDLGCFNHSENYREARKARSSKGGKLGGRGRVSFSRELMGVRELVGTIIELMVYDRLAPHVDRRMRELLSLLKCYITLAQYELKTAHEEVIEARHANTARELVDAQALREQIEALVYEDADEYDKQHDDPTRGPGAA